MIIMRDQVGEFLMGLQDLTILPTRGNFHTTSKNCGGG